MGLYLHGPAIWRNVPSEAMQFENSTSARAFCVTQDIQDAELLLLMGDPRLEMPLRLSPPPRTDLLFFPPIARTQAPSTAEL